MVDNPTHDGMCKCAACRSETLLPATPHQMEAGAAI